LIVAACLAFAAGSTEARAEATLTAIGTPGASGFTPTAINNLGQIVGYTNVGTQTLRKYSAAVYSGGSFTTLTGPGGSDGGNGFLALDINDLGQIVGNRYFYDAVKEGFLYDGGVFTFLSLPGDTSSSVSAINNLGQIVGSSGGNGYLYAGGVFTRLVGPHSSPNPNAQYYSAPMSISDSGIVVGTLTTLTEGTVTQVAQWNQGELTAEGFITSARRTPHLAVNNSGVIVGWVEFLVEAQGLLYADGVELNLNTVMAAALGPDIYDYAQAKSINDLNMVVGETLQRNVVKAFLYNFQSLSNPGQGILLEDLITLSDGTTPGFTSLNTATDINNLGQIVGVGTYFDGTKSFSAPYLLQVDVVPEPSTMALVVAAGAVGIFRLRGRASKSAKLSPVSRV
jgi:uncharacterized membrane protein